MSTLESTVFSGQFTAGNSRLPDRDVRHARDESVFRRWTEVSRRAARLVLLLGTDTAAGLLGVMTALGTWELVSKEGLRPLPRSLPLIATVFCIQPFALYVAGVYGSGRARRSLSRIAAGLLIAGGIGWVQAQIFGQLTPDLPNKTAYLYSTILIGAYMWPFRLAIDWLIQTGYRNGALQRRLLAIGSEDEISDLKDRIRAHSTSDTAVVSTLTSVEAMAGPDVIRTAIQDSRAQMVLLAPSIPSDWFRTMMLGCFECGVGVSLLTSTFGSRGTALQLRLSQAGALLEVFPTRLGVPQLAAKRTMDLVVTGVALAAVWPLLALVAIAIKIDSPGPILFRQQRLGLGARRFTILKFRTMVADADQLKADLEHLNEYADARLFKIERDPRITRLGRTLRRLSIDELPQLWNVLRGDMSLVGPRPCVPEEFAHYSPHHMERLSVVPGLTGPWQVNGRNSIRDFEHVIRLEQDYIRSWSLLSDLLILLKTVPTLFRHGAY